MPRPVVPDAIPYIQESGKRLRSWEQKYHGNPLSIPTWMTGQPPEEIVAAVTYVESGNDPFGVPSSPDGAIGPMQLTVGGREVGAWNRTDWQTGAGVRHMDADKLRDTQTNFDVGTFGLEFDREEFGAKHDVPDAAKSDWFATALYYFGCTPLPDGSPDPGCGDVYNNAAQYQATLESFVSDNYGEGAVSALKAGGGTGTATGTGLDCGLTDVGCWARKGADAAVSELFGSLSAIGPRIGLAVLGLGLSIVGFKALAS